MKTRLLITTAIAIFLITGPAHAQLSGSTTLNISNGNSLNSNAPASPGNNNMDSLSGNTRTNSTIDTNTGNTNRNGMSDMSNTNDLNSNVPASSGNLNTTRATGDTNSNSTMNMPSNMNSRQFDAFVTSQWDMNGDGIISLSEWDTANLSWFGANNKRAGTFAGWDINHNGSLDAAELGSVFSKSKLYSRYDTNGDGIIDKTEARKIPVR